MAFTPEFLDELRARVPLAGTIGRSLRLVKRGREHVALCPFHNEKTPSFTINEDKGFYHCFGCGEHGDVIGFLMQNEGLAFPEAVEAACAWFAAQLGGEAGKAARAYLEERGIDGEASAEFGLGYAPRGRDGLRQALAARGFDEGLIIEAGLVAKSDEGEVYDRFRDRIIFPIADRRGLNIAFGGRALGEARAKYLNSPETPLFHKGRTLYNLARARAPARQAGTVLVVEGYMDVIALAVAGLGHAVAPLGTALTEAQMEELWRLAPEPVLCLDGDAAGRRAAYRAAERSLPLLKPGHSLLFALLPNGEDPDSLVRRRGVRAMTALVEAAAPLSDMLWAKETASGRLDTPERRAALEQRLLRQVSEIRDETVKQYYRRHFKARLWEAFRERRAPGAWGA
ncbi:MAG: DNA primase, partial [Alphaproteobacteria bacterium]|nr:DNA primase [Alphaproteobacteria bacterium]